LSDVHFPLRFQLLMFRGDVFSVLCNVLYFSDGYYMVHVLAENSFSRAFASLNCSVEIPVSGLAVEQKYYVQLGDSATFRASVSQGSSVQYDWNFGDEIYSNAGM
jgi:hypothetical protein